MERLICVAQPIARIHCLTEILAQARVDWPHALFLLCSATATGSGRCSFAPANLRAASESPAYMALVQHYTTERYTLRYSGGLVPDLVHAMVKGPRHLRLAPCQRAAAPGCAGCLSSAPVAMVVECAGGKAVDAADGSDVLGRAVGDINETGALVCGNVAEVYFAIHALLA
ncbi:sedoheptulose-1,7-bisphosphatase [Cordyceps militaris]|uniref:Sedoheptulose-1,7-bisphosphatase n=1 Tax=Cordyceps militaris TaxID=73501 RepID=A0A2H4SU62_CORMI|nr:sedoheptulose-1,7-bisphosphatase [Cordyceps militaris]